MSVNILPLFKDQFESTLVSKAIEFTGETAENAKSAINNVAVAFLESLANKASTENGSMEILSLIGQHCFDEMAALIDTKNRDYDFNRIMNLGLILVKNIFAGKSGALIDWISANSGVKTSSAASIMSMVTPFIMCPVGQQVKSNGMNVSELTSLISDQRAFNAASLPAGLSSLINSPEESLEAVPGDPETKDQDLKLGKFFPWLLLILGLSLIWYFMRNDFRSNQQGATLQADTTMDSSTHDTSEEAVAPSISDESTLKGNLDDKGNWVAELGGEYSLVLPNGKALKVFENSVERNLVDFINTGEKDENILKQKWFTFDRLYFQKGKSELTEDSKTQLDNIAEILRAFPGVRIKMGGYTDSDGDDALNQKLSDARATVARKELLKRGIASARVEAEGYGEADPLCPANDNPQCKAINRRIDIRITGM